MVPLGTLVSRLEPRVPAAPGRGCANPLTLATSGRQGPTPLARPISLTTTAAGSAAGWKALALGLCCVPVSPIGGLIDGQFGACADGRVRTVGRRATIRQRPRDPPCPTAVLDRLDPLQDQLGIRLANRQGSNGHSFIGTHGCPRQPSPMKNGLVPVRCTMHKQKRSRKGLCVNCGYDLRGNIKDD